jgi:hypothetical protein
MVVTLSALPVRGSEVHRYGFKVKGVEVKGKRLKEKGYDDSTLIMQSR